MNPGRTIDIVACSRLRMGLDGHGIRTLVAVKGCTLRCKYCINPASWDGSSRAKRLTVGELSQMLSVDNLYFLTTGGGVTFGGGEPLLYSNFLKDFVDYIDHKWNICLETSLNVKRNNLESVIGKVDSYIIDIKSLNPAVYQAYTGGDIDQMLANLAYLKDSVPLNQITVRIPNIPGYTTNGDILDTEDKIRQMGILHIDQFTYKLPKQVNEQLY